MPTPESLWKILASPISTKTAVRYGFLSVAIVLSIRFILPILKDIAPLTEQDLPGYSYAAHFALTILFSLIAETLTFELVAWMYLKLEKFIERRKLRKELARKQEIESKEIKRIQEKFIENFILAWPLIAPRYKYFVYELRRVHKVYSDTNSAINYLRQQGWIHPITELPYSHCLYRLDELIFEALNRIESAATATDS
ncbi:hypothetical protein GFJ82_20130 [Salmonella enterica subsp. enterica serovar Enteritidis]|uniref:hypothetical protein n=1 Tax=Salmonella enterica TaxID=28901 RepID=UPI001E4BDCB5|nr:hypothetical protein [Salmonella enterica]MCD3051478.1 hypothetical protein [Salmonella enterica subsp. enterica serovar Enteritidis]